MKCVQSVSGISKGSVKLGKDEDITRAKLLE
jgi:hypothetical protein